MPSQPSPAPDAGGSDIGDLSDADQQQLADVLAQMTDGLARGDWVDVDTVAARYPRFTQEIRRLWGTVMVADAVGRRAQDPLAAPAAVLPSALELPVQFGDYLLLEELGRGGMGVVYRTRQLSLDRSVAIKMLLRGCWASEEDEARFRREAESAAGLTHPNIVPVYEVGVHEGHLYYSMKFISGRTLADMLAAGPLPGRQAARLLSRVSRAVQFAHQQGLLHRDLKPSNILIDEEGEPHVSDFGLARRVSESPDLTRSGAVVGTPAYMAPEQAAGHCGAVGPTSDVYSLGAILYQTLTGRPPFQAASPLDVALLVLEQDPVLPRVLNPKVERDLEMIALRCLQKPVDLRYASAADLADDLDAFLQDEPVSARSGRLSHVVARWLRETHHANLLENWGLLWMWHSLALFVICFLTNTLYWWGDENRVHYFLLWTAGLGAWAAVFWALPPHGARDLYRTADRPRVGRQHDQHRPALPHRIPPGAARAATLARPRPEHGHGVHGQSGHPVRDVLLAGHRPVRLGSCHGQVARVCSRHLRFRFGPVLLHARMEVPPAATERRPTQRRTRSTRWRSARQ